MIVFNYVNIDRILLQTISIQLTDGSEVPSESKESKLAISPLSFVTLHVFHFVYYYYFVYFILFVFQCVYWGASANCHPSVWDVSMMISGSHITRMTRLVILIIKLLVTLYSKCQHTHLSVSVCTVYVYCKCVSTFISLSSLSFFQFHHHTIVCGRRHCQQHPLSNTVAVFEHLFPENIQLYPNLQLFYLFTCGSS